MADPIEEQRLRTIQREYLDFLDDGVSKDIREEFYSIIYCRKMKVFIKIN
jgi:isocitrate dehydrogenase kinase/phosphatase